MTNPQRLSTLLVFLAIHGCFGFAGTPAGATGPTTPTDDTGAQTDHQRAERAREMTLELNLSVVPELEITDSSGNFDLAIAELELELPFLSISVAQLDFTWNGAEALPFSGGSARPWETLTTVELRKDFTRPIRDDLFFTSSIGLGLSFEEEITDSYAANAFAAVLWNQSADWSFLFGVGYFWHPEVDVEFDVFPAIGVSYRQYAERGFWASLGIPQTGFGYRFSPASSLSLSADAQTFVSRLADDSPVAIAGYAELVRFDVGLYYEHVFGDRFEIKAGPTFGFEGELKIHDRQGVLLETYDLESVAGFSLAMAVRF
ncbi:MAG: hypothetical protein AAGD38_02690 [Acidobacteriota bacterium]